jgi:carbon starvation protein
MTPVLAATAAFVAYFLAYRFYARHLARRVFALDPEAETPAHSRRDGVDYVPTRPIVLFGHHYASITGLAPMLGPAVAVIWGWLPAMLWVVLGAIFIGCVHDFSALVLSVRGKGFSIGKLAEGILGKRAMPLFHTIIFFGVSLAMGVFVFVIAKLFNLWIVPPDLSTDFAGLPGYPEAVLPSALLIGVAMSSGFLMVRRSVALMPVIIVGFGIQLVGVWLGLELRPSGAWPVTDTWIWILLVYAFVASVLPVWALLQTRDFLNSLLLYLGLGLAFIGLLVANPEFAAPAIVADPEGAPPIFPFVFIIIACGAASGFHGLVSSGTTAKQLDREPDARVIGYGGMIGESLLGLLAVLACTAGFSSPAAWHNHYASWTSAQGLATKIGAFIEGTVSFIVALGIPHPLAAAFIAVVVVSFALTSLDSGTRLLRFNIEEVAASWRVPGLGNRFAATGLACAAIGFFAFYTIDGRPAGLQLWALFGTTNQLLAALTLSMATLYLRQRDKPTWFTGLPALYVLGITLTAMVHNLIAYSRGEKHLLLAVGGILFCLALWLTGEVALALRRNEKHATMAIPLEG